MRKLYNFSAGPAMLPVEVMQQAQAELVNWNGLGMSVAEVSHRGKEFIALAAESIRDCRELLNIPTNYQILFLHGGARGQFAAIPMNLLAEHSKAAYVNTGLWSESAIQEARKYTTVQVVADSTRHQFTTIDPESTWEDYRDAAYLHYTDNETVHGIEFDFIPQSGDIPLIADMSSNIMSRPIDVNRFGLIYAGAQKNLGIAGITLVIIRDDLLQRLPMMATPTILNYAAEAKGESMLNTPATYSWYMTSLVFKWLKQQGGVAAMAQRNQQKADSLYRTIDQSNGYYRNSIEPRYRSRMNVVFTLSDPSREAAFLQQAEQQGLSGLKGHRAVGGIRASIYNAMPQAGVDALCAFMQEFASADCSSTSQASERA